MSNSAYKSLEMMADIFPSGGRASIDNEHDVPNAVGMFVDIFEKEGHLSHDEVAEFFRSKGWDEASVSMIADIADIVWLTMNKLRVAMAE